MAQNFFAEPQRVISLEGSGVDYIIDVTFAGNENGRGACAGGQPLELFQDKCNRVNVH